MQQLPLVLGPGTSQSFANFIGEGNEAALAAVREARDGLYLWGPAGSGKSHLLRAAARAASARGDSFVWLDADGGEPVPPQGDAQERRRDPPSWAGGLAQGGSDGDGAEWDERCRLLLLDACDAYGPLRQHAAFALFVEASTRGVPVLAAGRVPPVDLPLREDLRTRLASGLAFALQPLGENEVARALEREAERRGIALSHEVLSYLLTRFARDLGSLMALLDALDKFSLSRQRVVTVPLLKQMIAAAP